MLVKFEAQAFRSICRGVLRGDRDMVGLHLPAAYKAIFDALSRPNLSGRECESLRRALHYLDMIQGAELVTERAEAKKLPDRARPQASQERSPFRAA